MDDLTSEPKQSPRLTAFLAALPMADENAYCSPPGLGGGFRVKYIRRGMERGVIVVHHTGLGLAIQEPTTHGACGFCKGRKGSQPCDHCACAMCAFFHQNDERASPRVSQTRMVELARRLKTFSFAAPVPVSAPALDDDI